jgi:Tfp pilus assembly protein PilN
LQYEIGNLIPIPIEQAVFDFSVLGPGRPQGDGGRTSDILVVVAQRDVVKDGFEVARRAGLRVHAADVSALALLRAVPPPEGGGLGAVVCLGADLATVAVREGETPRFVRTVPVAGVKVVAAQVPRSPGGAGDGQKRAGSVPPSGGVAAPVRLDPVVEEVRSSLEYFLSHSQGAQLQEIVLTGGGALVEGVAEGIGAALNVPVRTAAIVARWSPERLGLSEEQQNQASFRWAIAVGLAQWSADAHALSLEPTEVKQRRQYHQAVMASAAGLVVVAAGLSYVSYSHVKAADRVVSQIAADNSQAAALQSKIDSLLSVTRLESQVSSRHQLAAAALSNDIDWVGLVGRIAAALPPGVTVTSLELTSSAVNASGNAGVTTENVGTVSISATTTGGPPSIAAFIRSVSKVRGLASLWVSTATVNGGSVSSDAGQTSVTVNPKLRARATRTTAVVGGTTAGSTTFNATADVTTAALSNRAANLPGGRA